MDLDASDEQLDCPFVYASAKSGYATLDLNDEPKDMVPLFETILNYIPAPEGDPDAGTQVLISTIDYNEYVGRIGVGKVDNGTINVNQDMRPGKPSRSGQAAEVSRSASSMSLTV